MPRNRKPSPIKKTVYIARIEVWNRDETYDNPPPPKIEIEKIIETHLRNAKPELGVNGIWLDVYARNEVDFMILGR